MKALLIRLQGAFVTLFALAVALIPAWIYLLVRAYAEPSGFWQELALGVVGAWILGSIQLLLMIFWIGGACWYWFETIENAVLRVEEADRRERFEARHRG